MFKFALLAGALLGAASAWAAVDPTLPPAGQAAVPAAQASEETLQLQAILRDRRGAVRAMINGQSLSVGDRIGGHQLVAINKADVVLEHAGQQRTVRLARPVITKSRP